MRQTARLQRHPPTSHFHASWAVSVFILAITVQEALHALGCCKLSLSSALEVICSAVGRSPGEQCTCRMASKRKGPRSSCKRLHSWPTRQLGMPCRACSWWKPRCSFCRWTCKRGARSTLTCPVGSLRCCARATCIKLGILKCNLVVFIGTHPPCCLHIKKCSASCGICGDK